MSVLTYGCESWTLKAKSERRIAAFEMKFLRRILKNFLQRPHNKYISNASHQRSHRTTRTATVKRRKLQWFCHTTRHNALAKGTLRGAVKVGRKRERPQQMYVDNIREWTGLEPQELCDAAHNRPIWRKISVEASMRAPLRSARSRNK